MKYKISYGVKFTFAENGIQLDNHVAFLTDKGVSPDQIKIEVLREEEPVLTQSQIRRRELFE